MQMKNYYEVLGVSNNASPEDIRKEFRRLAMQHHPDHNPESVADSETKFKDINEAYTVLSDTHKRRQYDYLMRVSDHTGSTVNIEEIFQHFTGRGFPAGAGPGKFRGRGCRKGWRCRRM